MKKEITKLDPQSVATMYGAVLAAIGLFFALLFLLFGVLFSGMSDSFSSPWIYGGGMAMVILMPVMYGVMGFILGYVVARLYNLLAPRIGGIKMYFNE